MCNAFGFQSQHLCIIKLKTIKNRNMKNNTVKKIVAFSAALICVSMSTAQSAIKNNEPALIPDTEVSKTVPLRVFELGFRYMPTFTAINLRQQNGQQVSGSADMNQGFGIMAALNITKHIGIQSELNYLQISQKYADNGLNRELKINYINVPVMLSLNTSKKGALNLNFVAGPQFGINIGSSLKTTGTQSDTSHAVVAVKKADVGLAYGAGLELALNNNHTFRLDLGYRGFYGLVDMSDNSASTTGTTNSYNVVLKTSRRSNGAYVGLTFLF
jgi:opacity protein-like surface antigen